MSDKNPKYTPRTEVINLMERILKQMGKSVEKKNELADTLYTLSNGKATNSEEAIRAMKDGTQFGRALYIFAEHIFDREYKGRRLPH